MATQKKSVPRSKRTRSKPSSRKSTAGRIKRFLRACSVSVVATFGVASWLINPALRDQLSLDPILAQFGFQSPHPLAPLVAPVGPRAQTRFTDCPEFFPARQPPQVPAGQALRELCFSAFAILHDGRNKTPVFVAQRLNRRQLLRAQGVDRTDRFYADARLPSAERAELADYRGSGYSRGHMAPAGDMHTLEAMAQSFSLANMVPQNQRHNGGGWSKIEQDTRKYVMRARGDVYVFTGPAYGSRPVRIGVGRVAVPSYLYKVVYDATSGHTLVHWQVNGPSTTVPAPISYAEFVRRTGLRLLPALGG